MDETQGADMELDADEALARALQREELHLRPRPRRAPPGDLAYMQALEAPQLATSSSTNAGVTAAAAAARLSQAEAETAAVATESVPKSGNIEADGAKSATVGSRASTSSLQAAKRVSSASKIHISDPPHTSAITVPTSPTPSAEHNSVTETTRRSAANSAVPPTVSGRQGIGGGKEDTDEERGSLKRKELTDPTYEVAQSAEKRNKPTEAPCSSSENTDVSQREQWEMLRLLAAESISAATTTASLPATGSQDTSVTPATAVAPSAGRAGESDAAVNEGRPNRGAVASGCAPASTVKENIVDPSAQSAGLKQQAGPTQKKRSARSDVKRADGSDVLSVTPKTGTNLQAWRQALSTRELQVMYKDLFGVATKVHNKDWILSKISGHKGMPPLPAAGKSPSAAKNPPTPAALPAPKPPSPPEQADATSTRCSRNDGKNWRCSERAVQGHKHCHKHLRWVNGTSNGESKPTPSNGCDEEEQPVSLPLTPSCPGSSHDKANGSATRASQSIKVPASSSSKPAEAKVNVVSDLPSPYKFKSLKNKWLSAYEEECKGTATDEPLAPPSSSARGEQLTEAKASVEQIDDRWEALVAASTVNSEAVASPRSSRQVKVGEDDVKPTRTTPRKTAGVQLEASNAEMRVANILRQIPAS